jgi:hypothetical protein
LGVNRRGAAKREVRKKPEDERQRGGGVFIHRGDRMTKFLLDTMAK